MKLRYIQPVLLAVMLLAVWCLDRAQAGEKIIFSSSKKDGTKTDLGVSPDKPALPTLDLTLMGARGSKAEEMAPIGAPPQQIDPKLLKKLNDKNKSEKDWNNDNDTSTDPDNTDERNKLNSNSKDRNRNNEKNNGREMNADGKQGEKTDRLDPFSSNGNTNSVDYSLAVPGIGGTTNQSLFKNNNSKNGETTFLGTHSMFSTKSNNEPLSKLPSRGFDPEVERSATLRLLGIEPRGSGASGTSSGRESSSASKLFQYSAFDALLGRGNNQSTQPNPGGFGDPLSSQSASLAGTGTKGLGPGESVFKTGIMSEIGSLGLNQSQNPAANSLEPPKIERSPLVLPVPRRKF